MWYKQIWTTHAIEYLKAIKRSELLVHAPTLILLETLCQVKEASPLHPPTKKIGSHGQLDETIGAEALEVPFE